MFHLYGFLIGLGSLTSAAAAAWLARRRSISSNIIWDGFLYALIPGIIGARIYHVVDLWTTLYSFSPISVIYVWQGGLGIIGGLFGGFFGLLYYHKTKIIPKYPHITFSYLANITAFGLPLGQIIGRLGNYINQEVYGFPSSLPWAIYIKPENRLSEFINFSTFHPLFAYESLWLLLGWFIMFVVERSKRIYNKSFFGFYLIWFGIGRFFLEFLRPDDIILNVTITGAHVNMAQVISLVSVASGTLILLGRFANSAIEKQN